MQEEKETAHLPSGLEAEQLRDGDTVVVCKLGRLARSTRDLLEISDVIAQAGAGLKSLSEPWADAPPPQAAWWSRYSPGWRNSREN
jgi:hypothetical protein